jgi:type VI protein secretion system component VasF
MSDNDQRSELADRLLALRQPSEDSLTRYRKEVTTMIERERKRLKFEAICAVVLWLFLVALIVPWLMVASHYPLTPPRVWFGFALMFMALYGAMEMLKVFINRARVDVLKEVKEAELRVLEAISRQRAEGA